MKAKNLKINKSFVFLPRKIFLSFLIVTLIMYFFSPWDWPSNNTTIFTILNILYLISFYFGYKRGIINYKPVNKFKTLKLSKFISISLILNLLFIYQKFLFKTKLPSLSLNEIVSKIIIGFTQPSAAYLEKHLVENSEFNTLSNPIVLIYFILLPILYFSIPLSLFYWKNLKFWQKFILILIIITDILSYVIIGTNKGIFDYIFTIGIITLIKKPSILSKNNFSKKKIFYLSLFIIILSVGLSYFVEGNKGRKKDNFNYDTSIQSFVNEDALILSVVPSFLEDTYIALDSYLTQGYYAMDMALSLPFQSSYGFGHNSFLMGISDKIFGKDFIYKKTYQYRIQEQFGYSSQGKWHSFYTWMANDISFVGVIFFVFGIAYFLGQIWLDVIFYNNPYSIILLTLLTIMIFYFSANNQVLGNQGSSFIFWFFFALWYRNRGKSFVYV